MVAERIARGVRKAVLKAARPAAASLLILLSAAAAAQPSPATLASCAGCHGADGNSTIPQYPSLAGQPRVFVENQLVLIRDGLREVPEMKDVVKGLPDEEIVALARFYAEQKPTPAAGPVRPASYGTGEELAQKNLCGTCHLPDYGGQNQVPRLAGQQEKFLYESMKQFRDKPGLGRDTIMAATLRGMSDANLADLAHYFATFRPR